MTSGDISISDLFEGAYLLCRGFHLKRITVMGSNGRKLCTFAFGKGAQDAVDEYRQGRATCNVALLKFTMKNLKDSMYEKIKEAESKEKQECPRRGRK